MSTSAPAPVTDTDDLLAYFSEYSGIPLPLVYECVRNYRGFNHVAWQECEGNDWRAKARVFYERSVEYAFDLLAGSHRRSKRLASLREHGHWDWLMREGRDVIEFGGGLGVTCSLLREAGKRVTYVDVGGPAQQFAKWYLERLGQHDIEMLVTPSEQAVLPVGRQWDVVFSESVIEHVLEPAATVETLARAVRKGGLLYLIIDAHEVSPGFPMHRHIHLDDLLAGAPTLRTLRHVLHEGDGLNAFRRD